MTYNKKGQIIVTIQHRKLLTPFCCTPMWKSPAEHNMFLLDSSKMGGRTFVIYNIGLSSWQQWMRLVHGHNDNTTAYHLIKAVIMLLNRRLAIVIDTTTAVIPTLFLSNLHDPIHAGEVMWLVFPAKESAMLLRSTRSHLLCLSWTSVIASQNDMPLGSVQ